MNATVTHLLPPEERRLIQRIARRVYLRHTPAGRDGRALTEEELFHSGVIGLLEARRSYKPDSRASWLVFAAYRIEGAMLDNLRKAPLIRLPHEVQSRVRKLVAAAEELESAGERADEDALAARLGWSRAEVAKLRGFVPTIVRAETESRGYDGEERETGRNGVVLSASDPESDPAGQVLRQELSRLLSECLEKLPEARDRIIVKARKLEDITLRELAESFGCSIESIRKREQLALRQLKECLQRGGWEGF